MHKVATVLAIALGLLLAQRCPGRGRCGPESVGTRGPASAFASSVQAVEVVAAMEDPAAARAPTSKPTSLVIQAPSW